MARLSQVFVPRDREFFDLFEEAGLNILDAADLLDRMLRNYPETRELAREILLREQEGDRITHDIVQRLNQTFVTPIDREDIHALIVAIDDIIDLIYLTSRSFVLYGVETPSVPMAEQMKLLVVLGSCLRSEIPALRRHEYDKLIAAGRVIREHEKAGDKIFREAVAELFHNPAIDAKILLRDKELLEDLESAVNKFEFVAERLKNLAVKHG